MGTNLMKNVECITITTSSHLYVDPPTFCSALQNIRRYLPNPSSITIIWGNRSSRDRHSDSDTETISSRGIGYTTGSGNGSLPGSVHNSAFDTLTFHSISSVSTLGQGAITAPNAVRPLPPLSKTIHEKRRRRKEKRNEAKDFVKRTVRHKQHPGKAFDMDRTAEAHRRGRRGEGFSGSRDFAERPNPGASLQTPNNENYHRGRTDDGISTHDFARRYDPEAQSQAPVDEKTREKSNERKRTASGFLGWTALCLLLIVNCSILKWLMNWRNKRDEGISSHDLAVPSEKEKDSRKRKRTWTTSNLFGCLAFCLMLIMKWPIVEWKKLSKERRDERMEWKMKLMVWRLEDRLDRSERIKHVGDGILGDSLWLTGGRKFWQ